MERKGHQNRTGVVSAYWDRFLPPGYFGLLEVILACWGDFRFLGVISICWVLAGGDFRLLGVISPYWGWFSACWRWLPSGGVISACQANRKDAKTTEMERKGHTKDQNGAKKVPKREPHRAKVTLKWPSVGKYRHLMDFTWFVRSIFDSFLA